MRLILGWARVILLNWVAIIFGAACYVCRALAAFALIGAIIAFCAGNWSRGSELAIGAVLWLAISSPCYSLGMWLIEFAARFHPKPTS